MVRFIETYRGYAIYFYEPGEYPGYQDDGYSAAGIARLYAYLPDLRNHIDALIEPEPPEPPPPEPPPPEPEPPEPPPPEPPPPEPPPPEPPPPEPEPPEFIETYKGVDIYWLPTVELFRGVVAPGWTAIGVTLEECRIEIEKVLAFLEPPPPGDWGWPLAGVQEWFTNLMNKVVAGPIAALQSFWTAHIQPKLEWVRDQIQLGLDWVYSQLEPIVSGISTVLDNVWDDIVFRVNSGFQAASEYAATLSSWLWDNISPVISGIATTLDTLWTNISTAVSGVITNITTALTNAKELILDKVIAKAGDIISNIRTALNEGLTNLWTVIRTSFTNVTAWITTSVDGLWDSLTGLAGDILSGMATALGDALGGLFDGMLKSLGNIAEMIFGAVNFVISKVGTGVMLLIQSFMDLLTGGMMAGSPPQEIMVASEILTQTMLDRQMDMIDAAYKSDPTLGELLASALSIQSVLMASATVALGTGLAADISHPFKNMGFRPTVREMVYWSGIPAVTAAIATTPTAIGLLTPLRYALMEKWTPMVPPSTDLIRFSVREVYLPERRDALIAFYPGGEYDRLMAKQGFKQLFREHYWMAHWVLPSVGQLSEMLYRGVISREMWTTYVRYNDLIPEMIPNLEEIIYKPYTRVDIRRMWDIGVVTDAEVLENYLWLGYDQTHAERMTLWTKAYVIAGDVRKLYSKGWIDEAGAKLMLVEAGVPEERLDVFLKRLVKAEQPARMEKERDLTKTDILRMFKNGVFTANETVGLLMDIGYDEVEAGYLVLLYEHQPLLEMKELTMSQILKSYRYEIYIREDAKIALQEAGWSETAAETLLKLEDIKLADAQIERARERDLSRTDIIKSIGAEIITVETGYNYLGYLGYSDWEIRVIGALEGIEFPAVGG